MRNVDWYGAGFLVWEIDPETDADLGEIAAAKSLMVAKAAFWAALGRSPSPDCCCAGRRMSSRMS